MPGAIVLLALYLTACIARWRIGRHYGEPFMLLGPYMLLDSWDHLRFSRRHRLFKVVIVLWAILGVVLCFTY